MLGPVTTVNFIPKPPSPLPLLRPHLRLFRPCTSTTTTCRLRAPNHRLVLLVCAAAAKPDRAAATAEIDMFRGRDGVWTAQEQKVVVLWDLDNKPPRGPPYDAAVALRRAAELFGRVVDISAYANRHAFFHLPQWVLSERRERRRLDILERKGLVPPPDDPYVCGVCGRKCRTNLDLKKHFRQLHVRERQKKLNRMRSLKGKKRQKYRERFITGNDKYEEAARDLLTPRTGYGLASELRRAGVFVKTVENKPQAADWALKKQMQHSMTRGIDWLFLVSDDSDFSEMIRRAREADLRTVVVGDGRTALGRQADLWVPWMRVEKGEVNKEVMQSGFDAVEANFYNVDYDNGYEDDEEGEGSLASSSFYDDGDMPDLDEVVDGIFLRSSRFCSGRFSAFSEEELVDGANVGSLSWKSEEEEDDSYI